MLMRHLIPGLSGVFIISWMLNDDSVQNNI